MTLQYAAEESAVLEQRDASLAIAPTVSSAAIERTGRRRSWLARLMLVHADVFALLFGYFVAERLFGPSTAGGMNAAGVLFVATVPLWLAGIRAAGLYTRDDDVIHHTTLDEIPALLRVTTIGTWAFAVLAWTTTIGMPPMPQLVGFWALTVALLVGTRAVARTEFRRDPDFPQNTVIVGAGTVGQLLGRKILKHPEYHVRLLGFVDAAPRERREDLDDLHILGSPAQLPELIDELNVERVIVAFSNDTLEDTMDLVRALEERDVRIDIVPRLFDVLPPRLMNQTVEGIPLISAPRLHLSRTSRVVKRAFDLVLATAALLALLPFIAAIAAAIKLDSRGPVFFRQRRIGPGDKPFRMFKFRTMVADADDRKSEFAHLNMHARAGGDPRMFKIQSDPRTTRVGRFLRRYSLDELPQLLNVVHGEMSLIGPRPLIPEEDHYIQAWGRKRLTLKPGMTGLWQVLGRSAIPFEEMVKLDYLYVTTWSLANDCRLLLQTVPEVFRDREGVY